MKSWQNTTVIERIRLKFGVAWVSVMAEVTRAAAALPPVDPVRVGIDETLKIFGLL